MSWGALRAAAVLVASACAAHPDELTDALAGGRFEESLRLADARLKSAAADARLWAIRGIALEKLERLPESLASFEQALTLEPGSLAALQGAAEVAYRTRSPKAAALVARVLLRDPGSETAHAMAGALAVEANRCAAAVDHFARSASVLRQNPPASAQYAGCLLELKRPREAAQVFERLVEAAPDSPAARYNLAVCQLQAGQGKEALASASAALAMSPGDAEVLNLFAAASAASGRLEGAITALRKAIEIAPTEERHYLELAGLCLDHDALDLALEVANAGLAKVPGSARLLTLRGGIRAERSDFEEAMRDFEQASALSPQELYGSVGLSLVLRQTDRVAEAAALLRQKLARQPEDATLNYLLADVLMRSDPTPGSPEFADARAALQRALRARPDLAKAHAALGRLRLAGGDPGGAVQDLRAAVELDSRDRLALNQLVMAYRRLGRQADAEAVAAQLKTLLEQERVEETSRNRVRLVKGAGGETPPRP